MSARVALLGSTARRAGSPGSSDDRATEALTTTLEEIAKASANPEDAVEPALDAITEAAAAAASAICFFDQRQQLLRLAAERGLSDEGCKSLRHVRRGLMGSWDMPLQSLNNRRAYVIQNASQNRYVPPLIDDPKAMRTVTCLPLFASATPVGSLVLVSTAPNGFTDAQLQSLDKASKALGRIIEAVRARANRLPTGSDDDEPPEMLDREQWNHQAYDSARITSSGLVVQGPVDLAPDHRFAEPQVEDSLAHKLAHARREAERAKELAYDWERKHQELAGELAAAAAREQRLREDLKNAATQLESFSTGTEAPHEKAGAAHVAEAARLQASLAEAESIAARERLRASDHERKLADLTNLLQEATEREEDLRRRLESGLPADSATPRSESAQVARLRARVTDLEATLAAERSRIATLEETHADLAGRLGESEASEDAYREGFHALAAEFEIRTGDLLATLDADRTKLSATIDELRTAAEDRAATVGRLDADNKRLTQELAASGAREHTLAEELEATRRHHQSQVHELEERTAAKAGEVDQLAARLAEAETRAEQLAGIEAERTRLAEELDAARKERGSADQEQAAARAVAEARVTELTAALEREQLRNADWERRHDALERDLSEVVERERARLEAALRGEEEAAVRAAQAEARSNEQAERVAELQEVRTRVAELEAAAARATARSAEWEERGAALERALDEERGRRSAAESTLETMRAATAEHEQADATRVAERSALDERLRALEEAGAATKRSAAEATRRAEHLERELDAATARAAALEHELETLRSNLGRERAETEAARAAAVADGDTVRSRLGESEMRIKTLTDAVGRAQETIETLHTAERQLHQEMQSRDHELAHARERLEAASRQLAEHEATVKQLGDAEAKARELEAQVQAMRSAMAEAVQDAMVGPDQRAAGPAPSQSAPVPSTPAKPANLAKRSGPPAVASDRVTRIAVVDAPDRWASASLHGIEVVPVEPGADLHARLDGGSGERVLVNLASPAALDTLVAARAAGLTAAACACIVDSDADRGLPLGFVEVVPVPVDTDQVLTMLSPFVRRGTRVLTAGGDADVFISLRQALSRSGASVSMAWDGKQGVDLLAMVSPEVVVVDLDLPPKGGLDLVARLPEEEKVPMVAVIPGRIDHGRNLTAALARSNTVQRVVSLDRLLEHVRRTGIAKT